MPIITVHARFPEKFADKGDFTKNLNSEIQEAAADAMGESRENFWVRSVSLDSDWSHPSYITVLAKKGRNEKAKRHFVAALAAVAAKRLETTADKIWIHYQELNLEEIWYGGRWGNE